MPSLLSEGFALWRWVAVLWLLALSGCATLPSQEGRVDSRVLPVSPAQSRLLRAVTAAAPADAAGRSGVAALAEGPEALVARLALIDAAAVSIDIQCYIWHGDLAGTLVMAALHRAAERGVRVRLLLDDNGTDLDGLLAALDRHPNIEVRLFNPFASRTLPRLGFLTEFSRLNRRMHNKSMTADDVATIVGGRNVGDEYFDATESTLFIDLDVLAVGPVAREVSADFDRYWASPLAFPIDRLVRRAPEERVGQLLGEAAAGLLTPAARAYVKALETDRYVRALLRGSLPLEWTMVTLLSDDPDKALGDRRHDNQLVLELTQELGKPRHSFEIVSPYFVPSEEGVRYLGHLARTGVHVHVLTNSLAATDVPAVHSGYARWRRALLDAGVALYEMKPSANPVRTSRRDRGWMGSSSSSLHAKTFAVDRKRVFVGSLNFDPRSFRTNTEMGFLIESPAMAAQLSDLFAQGLKAHAWKVQAGADGTLQWWDLSAEPPQALSDEPKSSWGRRITAGFLRLLPIEPLL